MSIKTRSIVVTALCLALAAPVAADEFSDHWHDGKAELDGYELTVARYGEERVGYAVMIFVTEPFSESKRVKVDDHRKNTDDTFDALKLNLVRDFRTGIYDYNTMVSVFARASNFEPVKVTFSSAEWCGHVYTDLVFNPDKIRGHYFSYFENESGAVELDGKRDGVAEDNLFILLRGLRGDYLGPGESRKVAYLPSAFANRLLHRDMQWTTATISRDANTERVRVGAGEFEAMVYRVEVADGRSGTFFVEAAYPHRIVKWALAPDVSGELVGSARLKYWGLNANGHEKYLQEIGLESLVSR